MDWAVKKYPVSCAGAKQRYSRSAVVGNLIFSSGMDGVTLETGKVSSNDIGEQTVVALDKVKGALSEAGGTMDNIVRTVVFLREMRDYERMREAELEYYQRHAPLLVDEPPASRVIQSHSLVSPESSVEIDVIGVISRDKPGWEVKKYPMYYSGVKQRYSKSAVVGNLLFCSGMDGRTLETGEVSSNDVAEQMVVALDKVKGALREAGATMDNIVETVIFLRDLKDYPRMRETEVEYYQNHACLLVDEPPASTFIRPASLASPECLVEIQATAVVAKEEPGWRMRKYPEYCEGKRQVVPWVPAGWPHTSKAVVVGNLIIGSGAAARTPRSPETVGHSIAEQTKVTLDVIKDRLEDAGGSMNDVVKNFILLKDITDYPLMREAELEFYQQHAPRLLEEPPVSTVIQPYSLARPDYLVEIDVLGVISR